MTLIPPNRKCHFPRTPVKPVIQATFLGICSELPDDSSIRSIISTSVTRAELMLRLERIFPQELAHAEKFGKLWSQTKEPVEFLEFCLEVYIFIWQPETLLPFALKFTGGQTYIILLLHKLLSVGQGHHLSPQFT